MHLLTLSDLHEIFPEIDSLPDADAVLIAGDLTEIGTKHWPGVVAAQRFMEKLAARYPALFWIPGNHDIGIGPEFFAGTCLLDRTETLGGLTLTGIALSTCFDLPKLKRHWTHMTDDPAIDAAAFAALPAVDLLVAHSPPLGLLDDAYGSRIGSPGLRDYIDRHAPKLVLCGHCHEGAFQGEGGQGVATRGATTIVNAALHVVTIDVLDGTVQVGPRRRL